MKLNMKQNLTAILLFASFISFGQFEMHRTETDNSSDNYADCYPSSKTLGSKSSKLVLRKNYYGMSLQLLYACGDPMTSDYTSEERANDFRDNNVSFTFYSASGKEELTYSTTPTDVELTEIAYEDAVYIFFDKEKLYAYFKKYSKVKITGIGFGSYSFSLSGFTVAYNSLNH